jgi:hypothetical protein
MIKRIYKKIKVDSKWIEKNIKKPGWQRNLYPSRVNHFINHLRDGTFQSSLITVADNNGKYIILDGQHKLEAISKFQKEFEMDFCIHEGLDEEGMIKVYKMLNNVKQPRLIDDIKIHVGKKEWLDCYMKEEFPINITFNGGVNSMRIDNFLNVIYNGFRKDIRRKNLTRKTINEFIEELDKSTFFLMSDFCRIYKKAFGEPTRDNWLYKNVIMFSLFRAWLQNKDYFSQEEFINAFRRIESNDSIRRDSSSSFDLNAMDILTRKIYNVLNYRRSSNKFEIFWEEDLVI